MKIEELEKQKEEKQKLKEKLEAEKEMMQRKVKNLQKSPINERKSVPMNMHRAAMNEMLLDVENHPIETEMDYEDEDEIQKLDAKKIYNKKNVVEEINSDLENQSVRDAEFSDCTSMTSSASFAESLITMEQMERNTVTSNLNMTTPKTSSSMLQDNKRLYQEFVKTMLKVKFEKFNNSHSGQKINEKTLFKECMKRQIQQRDWTDFIINELQQPQKYIQIMKRDSRIKNYKQYVESNMEVINEEM